MLPLLTGTRQHWLFPEDVTAFDWHTVALAIYRQVYRFGLAVDYNDSISRDCHRFWLAHENTLAIKFPQNAVSFDRHNYAYECTGSSPRMQSPFVWHIRMHGQFVPRRVRLPVLTALADDCIGDSPRMLLPLWLVHRRLNRLFPEKAVAFDWLTTALALQGESYCLLLANDFALAVPRERYRS